MLETENQKEGNKLFVRNKQPCKTWNNQMKAAFAVWERCLHCWICQWSQHHMHSHPGSQWPKTNIKPLSFTLYYNGILIHTIVQIIVIFTYHSIYMIWKTWWGLTWQKHLCAADSAVVTWTLASTNTNSVKTFMMNETGSARKCYSVSALLL